MVFDNKPLLSAKKNVERYEQLIQQLKQYEERLEDLTRLQPVLEEKLRKEAAERNETARKATGFGPIAWMSKNDLTRQIMEAENAEQAYLQAGAEYEAVLNKREACAVELEKLKDAHRDYETLLTATINQAKNMDFPLGARLRKMEKESVEARTRGLAYDALIENGSSVIRECTIGDEALAKLMKRLSTPGVSFGTAGITQYSAREMKNASSDIIKLMENFIRKMQKNDWLDWFMPQQLQSRIGMLQAQQEQMSGMHNVPTSLIYDSVKQMRETIETIGTLMFAITDRLRMEVAVVRNRAHNLRSVQEKAVLEYRAE
ncbi:MAG: hypothetical protein J5643_05170 [Lachnospiraceae bacterium]|nr:hypothetical protein [Lachnospiraceae bacterium]